MKLEAELAAIIGALIIFMILGVGVGVQTYRLRSLQADFKEFKLAAKAAADKQEIEAKAKDTANEKERKRVQDAWDKDRKERSDRFASLYAKYSAGVLNSSANPVTVPSNPAGAGGVMQPGQACFDTAELTARINASIRRYEERASAILNRLADLVRRGDQGLADSGAFYRWAEGVESCKP